MAPLLQKWIKQCQSSPWCYGALSMHACHLSEVKGDGGEVGIRNGKQSLVCRITSFESFIVLKHDLKNKTKSRTSNCD